MLLIDAANVVGSRPDGWWRDRAGASARLVERVRAAVETSRLPPPVVIVLEGEARAGMAAGEGGGVEIVHAGGEGDATLVALTDAARSEPVVVVSADRALGGRCRALGADVVGPTWLLERIE